MRYQKECLSMLLVSAELKMLYIDFAAYCKSKNYKSGKGKLYQKAVWELLYWMEKNDCYEISDLNSKVLDCYIDFLLTRPNKRHKNKSLSVNFINHNLFAIRLFLKYLIAKKYIDKTVIPPQNFRVKSTRLSLSEEEIKLLFKNCLNDKEMALLALAYGCGLRRSEIVQLNVNDVNFKNKTLSITKGKGNKARDIPMNSKIANILHNYLFHYRYKLLKFNNNENAFLLGSNGKRISGDSANKLLKTIVKRTNNYTLQKKQVSLHILRHSIATHLADNNVDIEYIKHFMGHAFINTTIVYLKNRKIKSKYKI
jgi:site-specific recombinase XerD